MTHSDAGIFNRSLCNNQEVFHTSKYKQVLNELSIEDLNYLERDLDFYEKVTNELGLGGVHIMRNALGGVQNVVTKYFREGGDI